MALPTADELFGTPQLPSADELFGVSIDDTSIPMSTKTRAAHITSALTRLTNDAEYGLRAGISGGWHFLSNIAGGIKEALDMVGQAKFKAPELELPGDPVVAKTQQWMEERYKATMPLGDRWFQDGVIEQPEGFVRNLNAVAVRMPFEVAKFIPLTRAVGAVGGFALHSLIENLHKDPNERLLETIRGGVLGAGFQAAQILPIFQRAAVLGTLGFGGTEGNLEQRMTAGGTMAVLSMLTPRIQGVGLRQLHADAKPLTHYIPDKSRMIKDLESTYKYIKVLENSIKDIETRLAGKKQSPFMRETLVSMKQNEIAKLQSAHAARNILEDGLYTTIKLSERLIGQDYRTAKEMLSDLVTFYRTPSKTKPGKTFPVMTAKHKDITPFQDIVVGSFIPGKYMSHPLIKWSVDRVSRWRIASEYYTDRLLRGVRIPEAKEGASLLRYVNPLWRKDWSTERGALYAFSKLPLKEQQRTVNALIATEKLGDLGPTQLTKEWLTKYAKLTPGQADAALGIRRAVDRASQHYNKAAKAAGEKPLEGVPNFVPHTWPGDFKVYVNSAATNSLIHVGYANTRLGAEIMKSRLTKQFGNKYKVEWKPSSYQRGQEEAAMMYFSEIMHNMKDAAGKAAIEAALRGTKQAKGFGVHKISREHWAGGWAGTQGGKKGVKEFTKAINLYVEGAIRAGEALKMQKDLSGVLSSREAKFYPNARGYIQRYANNALGVKGNISKAISDVTRNWLGENGVAKGVMTINQAGLYTRLLFGNVRYLLSNAWQPYQTLPAKLMHLKTIHGVDSSITKALLQSIRDMIRMPREAQEILREAIKRQAISPHFIKEAAGQTQHVPGRVAELYAQSVFNSLTGRHVAAGVEQFARAHASLIFYNFLKNSKKLTPKEMKRDVPYLTDKYMVEYNHVERPLMYGEQGLGTIGRPLGLFKTWQQNWFAQAAEHVRAGMKYGEWRPLAVFLGGMTIAHGILGTVGIRFADNILDTLGLETLSSRLLKSEAPAAIQYGLPSAALGVDITSTLAAPGLQVGDFFSWPGLEYATDVITESFKYMSKLMIDGPQSMTPTDHANYMLKVAPTSFKGFIERKYTDAFDLNFYGATDGTTLIKDSAKQSRGVLVRDTFDWISRFMAGRSLKESQMTRTLYELSRLERNKDDSQDSLVDLVMWTMMRGEPVHDWMIEKSIANGYPPETLMDQVKNRIETTQSTVIERMLTTGTDLRKMQREEYLRKRLGEGQYGRR